MPVHVAESGYDRLSLKVAHACTRGRVGENSLRAARGADSAPRNREGLGYRPVLVKRVHGTVDE